MRLILLVAVIVLSTLEVNAATLHYVVVGSGNYAQGNPEGWGAWDSIPSADRSTYRVSQRLSALGGVGLRLKNEQSSGGLRISREDILLAIAEQGQKAKQDPDKPLFVVYIIGHGISEGIAWNHFSVPSDVLRPKDFPDVLPFSEVALYAGTIVDQLKELDIPYVLLLDSCYEGDNVSFQSPVLTPAAIENLESVSAILKFFNQFRGPNPVVFSAAPGKQVPTVVDPVQPDGQVGPLARRFLLATEDLLKEGVESLKLERVVRLMACPNFDLNMSPVSVWSSPEEPVVQYSFRKGIGKSPKIVKGTSEDARYITEELSTSSYEGDDHIPANLKLSFSGPADDWISKGKTVEARQFDSEMPAYLSEDHTHFEYYFINASGTSGSITFSGPEGKPVSVGYYPAITRASTFPEGTLPGFDLSFDGAGCNEISGSLNIETLVFGDGGAVTKLKASFEQHCDEGPPLMGTVQWGFKQ